MAICWGTLEGEHPGPQPHLLAAQGSGQQGLLLPHFRKSGHQGTRADHVSLQKYLWNSFQNIDTLRDASEEGWCSSGFSACLVTFPNIGLAVALSTS